MSSIVAEAVRCLRLAGETVESGLAADAVRVIEERVGFRFGPEHRELLQLGIPLDEPWIDWKSGSAHRLRERLSAPVEGVLFDVEHNDFWPMSWGPRPATPTERRFAARGHLARIPRLVPLRGNRYITADPRFVPSPVFSVHQTDAIYYGDNLLDYVTREFHQPPPARRRAVTRVPFWSDLAEGAENSDL